MPKKDFSLNGALVGGMAGWVAEVAIQEVTGHHVTAGVLEILGAAALGKPHPHAAPGGKGPARRKDAGRNPAPGGAVGEEEPQRTRQQKRYTTDH